MRARLFHSHQPQRQAFGKRTARPISAVADYRRDPTATEAAAYVGTVIAEYAGWCVIAICALMAWVGSPA